MAPGPILRIRRGRPLPYRHRTAIVETHNMKALKLKNPLRSAATAPLPLRSSGNVPLIEDQRSKEYEHKKTNLTSSEQNHMND